MEQTKTLVLSILGTYANGIVLDHFIDGFNRRKRICILTEEYKELQNFIVYELHRGVTLYPAIGGYNNEEKIEIVTGNVTGGHNERLPIYFI